MIGIRGVRDVLMGLLKSTPLADALAARISDLAYLRDTLAPEGAAAPVTWAALKQPGLLMAHSSIP